MLLGVVTGTLSIGAEDHDWLSVNYGSDDLMAYIYQEMVAF